MTMTNKMRFKNVKRLTKKELAISLHASGRTVEEIAQTLKCSPSYVANSLIASGEASEYNDLYTSAIAQNAYARMFRGVLRFKDVRAAQESIERIDALFHEFARSNDRRGQHQAQLMALIGKNRAEGIGKFGEARIFSEWLVAHLDTARAPACDLVRDGTLEDRDRAYDEMSPYEVTLAFA
jgi:hypothetical protein